MCNELLTPAQLRAARALLGWTVLRLAKESGVGITSIQKYENHGTPMTGSRMLSLRMTLRNAGVRIIAHYVGLTSEDAGLDE